jgi:hypothetical protein
MIGRFPLLSGLATAMARAFGRFTRLFHDWREGGTGASALRPVFVPVI